MTFLVVTSRREMRCFFLWPFLFRTQLELWSCQQVALFVSRGCFLSELLGGDFTYLLGCV